MCHSDIDHCIRYQMLMKRKGLTQLFVWGLNMHSGPMPVGSDLNRIHHVDHERSASPPPPYFLRTSSRPAADWVPADAENYRRGRYSWRIVIPVLSHPDKQRQRIPLNGPVMTRHWRGPVSLSRASGCSREHSYIHSYSQSVNVQPQTGTDAELLWGNDTDFTTWLLLCQHGFIHTNH